MIYVAVPGARYIALVSPLSMLMMYRFRRVCTRDLAWACAAAATAMPETATGRPELGHASAIGTAEGVETAVQSNVEDVKVMHGLHTYFGICKDTPNHRHRQLVPWFCNLCFSRICRNLAA